MNREGGSESGMQWIFRQNQLSVEAAEQHQRQFRDKEAEEMMEEEVMRDGGGGGGGDALWVICLRNANWRYNGE